MHVYIHIYILEFEKNKLRSIKNRNGFIDIPKSSFAFVGTLILKFVIIYLSVIFINLQTFVKEMLLR